MTTDKRYLKILAATALLTLCALLLSGPAMAQRKITPVIPKPATEAPKAPRAYDPKANLAERQDAQGNIVLVDTITGEEWVDSTAFRVPGNIYPLLESVTVGVDLWDPAMRLLGTDYGLIGFWGEVSLHNRYKPVFEFGLGQANITPDGMNYTYKSPMAPFFKIGVNYNMFYNNNPKYQLLVGLRYGFSPFKYEITDATLSQDYWGDDVNFSVPQQSSTAGYFEFCAGVRVGIWNNLALGWMVKYHSILHESKPAYGKPMYIPGFGKRGTCFTASFSISYTLTLGKPDPALLDGKDNNKKKKK